MTQESFTLLYGPVNKQQTGFHVDVQVEVVSTTPHSEDDNRKNFYRLLLPIPQGSFIDMDEIKVSKFFERIINLYSSRL